MKKINYIGSLFSVLLLVTSCGVMNGTGGTSGGGFNLFTIDQDRELGAQVAFEIDSNSREYPQLDSASNPKVYKYLYDIRDKILNSGNVELKEEFAWRLRIIDNDEVLNAFCTPGGYIYVYTGLMKYLDTEDQLAGVLAHEIGHADKRHSTRQMTTMFGIQILLDVIAGDKVALKQVSGALIGLKFSRNHETEADECSVRYLCPTDYNADGGAGFFEKIEAEGGGKVPEFLSTHPDPGNRIEFFHAKKVELECKGTTDYKDQYTAMKALLP
jgi:predicted Zn-dependent protease